MSSIFQLQDYKKAKIICKEIEAIDSLLTKQLQELKPFSKYSPVYFVFNSILENKALLDLHYKKYKEIVDKKGELGV
jgi:hypothetical protein